ncbi:MAG: hypothetical protein LBC61_02695 [Candidatus Peribacteria bacterium]|nr:hypothetical protein [Candidatus Peribacteria bacterium]
MKDITLKFVDVEKLVDVFEEIPKYKDDSKLPDFMYKNGDISLEKVSFAYNKNLQVLENFSLKLE